MKTTRIFGKTGIEIPVFSCGGVQYAFSWRKGLTEKEIPPDSQANVQAIVDQSMTLGINHFETANMYGTSELQLGLALQKHDRASYILQTKLLPQVDKCDFYEQCQTSLRSLKTDYIDLLTLHGINSQFLYDWMVRYGLEWVEEFRERGLCKYIGFSTHAPNILIERCLETGRFDYIFLHYYFTDRSNEGALQLARQQNLGVYIISPNQMGGKLYEPSQKLVELCEPMHPMAFNALFLLSHNYIHSLSHGPKRPEDFAFHLEALKQWRDKMDIVAEVRQRLDAHIDREMGSGWHNSWFQGLPVWSECPLNMNIIQILRLYTMTRCLGIHEFAKSRYNQLGTSSHWFPGVKVQADQLDLLDPYIESSPFKDRIKEYLKEAHALLDGEPVLRQSQRN